MDEKIERIKELAKDMGIAFELVGTTRFGPVAESLVEAGYRKESDTAREILQKGKYCMPSGLRDWIEERYGVDGSV